MLRSCKFLKNYFESIGISPHFVDNLKAGKPNAHPSWYKLLLHKHFNYNYDYVLCWDLDLLPVYKTSFNSILHEIDFNKFYAVQDTLCYVQDDKNFYYRMPGICDNFRWNCGLLGIPRCFSSQMESIYSAQCYSNRPSWEQYFLNDYFHGAEYKIKDGSVENNVLIVPLLSGQKVCNNLLKSANCFHYSYPENHQERIRLLNNHIMFGCL